MTAPGGTEPIIIEILAENQDAVRELGQTRLSIEQVGSAILESTAAYKRGEIEIDEYRRRLEALNRTAVASGHNLDTVAASTRSIQRTLGVSLPALQQTTVATRALSTSTVALGTSARKARQGLGTIRSSLASLTAMSIGTRGTFGTLGGALLQFAAGIR